MSNTSSSQTSTSIIEAAPAQGFFELTFSNSRKHGLKPIQTHHCQGALYINSLRNYSPIPELEAEAATLDALIAYAGHL